ncbi:VWA domain-containing protein [Haloferula sp.]|uniref:VWA domain-containing protein n=1 Tax=Haloferula sp. TaxID=2497595 RepID=UPI00329E6637
MNYFVIQWPWMLLLLILVVPLTTVLGRARAKRRELREKVGVGSVVGEGRRDGLRMVAVVLMILALTRPGYAPERRSVSQSGRDVVFAIDVSRSMLAEDAHPSRLEAAKQGVRDALAGFGSERVGLVIYAGSSSILCPLTYDYDFVRYMLEQVNPRSVDFGGTTVLSAVEKTVDNVFSDERKGMQDLVVLTDGEDHVPDAARVAGLLDERGVDLLLVGLGDPSSASRIPVVNEEGGKSYLKHDGDFVSTRLNVKVLEELADKCQGASFVAPGTAAFDLGELYVNYAAGKPVEGAVGADSFVVYKEAGFALIGLALVLLLVGSRFGQSGALLLLLAGLLLQPVRAGSFDEARSLQVEGKLEEALELYAELDGGSSKQVAAVRFNEGLCHLTMSEQGSEASPGGSLAMARMAQRSFLEAKRLDRDLDRAGMRLDMTAGLIARYEEALKREQEKEQEIQEKLEAIIERLKVLHERQSGLFVTVRDKAPKPVRPKRGAPQAPPAMAPVTAKNEAVEFVEQQQALGVEGKSIRGEMEKLESTMMANLPEGMPPEMSVMREPLRLMGEAIGAQEQAAEQLGEWEHWTTAIAHQQIVLRRIEEILALLEGGDSDDSGEGEDDEGEWDDEGDWDEYEDGEEGSPSSMPMEGDMAAGSEMAPLPVPNYSVEDLLMEEQGSLQFREQQRAKAQEGKVKKDW